MADPASEPRDSRLGRARKRVDDVRQEVGDRASQLEEHVPAARAAVRAYEHDRLVGGEIMAGAIAFRLFVFVLPMVLVLVILLGGAADATGDGAAAVSKQAGISGIAAQSVSESARLSNSGRWITLALALFAVYSTSKALARATRIGHALAWAKPVPPMKRTWRASLVVVGTALTLSLVISAVSRLNATNRLLGLACALLAVLVYAAIWFSISLLLPHADAQWTALLPGAILVGFGVMILHLVTVYYVSRKVGTSSQLYGPLGAAVAILGWAYLVGRLTVASAVLNASLHRARATPQSTA